VTVECEPLRGKELQTTISAYVREGGYSLPPGAGALIINMLGSDLMTIYNALDKVMLYCGERKQIDKCGRRPGCGRGACGLGTAA